MARRVEGVEIDKVEVIGIQTRCDVKIIVFAIHDKYI